MAYDEAIKAKNQTEKARLSLQSLLSDVEDFLGLGRATPEDVKKVIYNYMIMSNISSYVKIRVNWM